MTEFTLLIINSAAALFMTGVIWFVQIVHYPLFIFADKEKFPEFSKTHSNNAGYIVIFPMLIELITAVMLLFLYPSSPFHNYYIGSMFLLALIWISTFIIQVPMHRRLAFGYHNKRIDLLIKYNWIRTIGWTSRSILLLYLVLK